VNESPSKQRWFPFDLELEEELARIHFCFDASPSVAIEHGHELSVSK
jgi:hypothetical protein